MAELPAGTITFLFTDIESYAGGAWLAELQERLDPAELSAAWSAGRRVDFNRVVTFAGQAQPLAG